MKIGIDIRALQWEHRYRGIGVYLTNLLETLSRTDQDNEYLLFAWDGPNPLRGIDLADGFNYKIIKLRKPTSSIIGQKLKNIFNRDIKLKPDSIDVFLQPDPAFGLVKNAPNVAVAYDMIELIYKDEHYPVSFLKLLQDRGLKHAVGNKLRWRLYKWHLSQFKRVESIIAISEATKKDLLRFFPQLSASKITVVPLASSLKIRGNDKKSSSRNPTILYVGAADYRKNVIGLVKDFEKVKQALPDTRLMLVGKDFAAHDVYEHKKLWEVISNSPHRHDIQIKGYVAPAELTQLYAAATLFVFPSIYEGFGMPILDAMASGTPVITYNTSSLPEVAGSAALLVKPGSDLAQPIIKLLSDSDQRQAMIKAGLAQAKRFSWDNTATMTLEVLKKAADENSD